MSKYTDEIAKTTKDPNILTDILRNGNNDWVSFYAPRNPNCPTEMLVEISEMLVEILKKGNNDGVSNNAAKNPNCPIPELHQWLIITNNMNNPIFANLLPKIQEHMEEEHNKLLKKVRSQFLNPILSLEL
jgi:hypothetical protein